MIVRVHRLAKMTGTSPRLALRKTYASVDRLPMGIVETALSTAQMLATAALQAEREEDGLSTLLDSLPADSGEDLRSSSPSGVEATEEKTTTHRKAHWKSRSVGEAPSKRGEGVEVNFNQNQELWQLRAISQSQLNAEGAENKSFRSNQEFWELRQKHTPDLVMDLPVLGSTSPKEVGEGNKSMSVTSLTSLSSSSSGEDDSSLSDVAASPTGPESPDMTTAAERFAKQNQCTLKKNTKAVLGASMDAQTQTSKGIKRSKHVSAEGGDVHISEGTDVSPAVRSNTPEADVSPVRAGPQTTPKFAPKFAHVTEGSLQATPNKPQVKAKPQILRKPVLPVAQTQPPSEVARRDET